MKILNNHQQPLEDAESDPQPILEVVESEHQPTPRQTTLRNLGKDLLNVTNLASFSLLVAKYWANLNKNTSMYKAITLNLIASWTLGGAHLPEQSGILYHLFLNGSNISTCYVTNNKIFSHAFWL